MFETSYSVVERALVRTYDIPEKALGAFRGRLGNLQKHAIFGPRNMPGRGRALAYTPDMTHRMIFACEMFELGVSPAEVLDLITVAWDRSLRKIFDKAEQALIKYEPGPDDIILHIGGVSMMKNGWSNTVPNVNSCSLRQLPDYVARWMRMNPEDPYPSNLPPRALIVNLSARLRSFHAAFADSHMRALAAENAGKGIGASGRSRKK
jgi:hypothetical protein